MNLRSEIANYPGSEEASTSTREERMDLYSGSSGSIATLVTSPATSSSGIAKLAEGIIPDVCPLLINGSFSDDKWSRSSLRLLARDSDAAYLNFFI
jgi:hypothetical protein